MLLALIFILFAGEANAKQSHLTCSVDKMEIIYVAGGGAKRADDISDVVDGLALLLVPESDFSDKGVSFAEPIFSKFGYLNSQKLEKAYLEIRELGLDFPDDEAVHQAVRLGAVDWQRGIQFVKYFNPLLWTKSIKTLATLGGAVVTGGISAHKSINTLSSRISINLISQKKSLVITHGLGQQVFNIAYSNLLSGPRKDELGYVSGIALGMLSSILPPSPADNPRFHYVLNRGDEILRSNTFANVKPNAYFDGPNPDDSGHDIIKTYFSDAYVNTSLGRIKMLDFTKEQIKRSVSGLLNNDPDCCEKRQGKRWVNESGCEEGQETCLGGFLEKTVKLKLDSDDELELSKESVICGDVKIETNRSTVKIEDSKIIGPATIKGDVELKNVKLDASAPVLNFNRALIDGEDQYVKIDFTGSTYTQSNIVGRPQIADSVEIKSNKPEAVIVGSPTIKNRVKLYNSKLTEVRPPTPLNKSLNSQIVLDGEFGEVVINKTRLEGKANVQGPVQMNEVTQFGTASISRATLNKTQITNDYFSIIPKPGIKIGKDSICDRPLVINDSEIRAEADISACGDIYGSALIEGHVQVRGRVNLGGKFYGEVYDPELEPMKIHGSSDDNHGIVIGSSTEVHNRPTIEGNLVIDGMTKIFGNGTYKGVKQTVSSGATYSSFLAGGNFIGMNNFSGYYYIAKGLTDSTVVGEYTDFGNGAELSTNILNTAVIQGSVNLKGPMSIEGTLGAQTTVEGKSLGTAGGVIIRSSASYTGAGKTIKGGVLLDPNTFIENSDIYGSEIDLYTANAIMHIDGSTVENSTLNGIGRITGSYLFANAQGSGNSYYIDTSAMEGGSISGNSDLRNSTAKNSSISSGARVVNATLNTVTASNGAYLCNRSYSGVTYGGEYNCEEDETLMKIGANTTASWVSAVKLSMNVVREAHAKVRRTFEASASED